MAKDLKLSRAEAGWFVRCFALAAAPLGPPLTMLAGRCDPRHVLITVAIVFAAGNLAIAWAPHLFQRVVRQLSQRAEKLGFKLVAPLVAGLWFSISLELPFLCR